MKKSLRNPVFLALIAMALFTSQACHQQTAGDIPYNPDSVRSHILPIQQAIVYTKNFRDTRDTFYTRVPELKSQLNLGNAEAFNRDAIAVLLNQKDKDGNLAAGVRIYYGLDGLGQVRMVLVPYDTKGNDIINQLISEKAVSIPGIPAAQAQSGGGQTIENGQRCPTICDNGGSGLN